MQAQLTTVSLADQGITEQDADYLQSLRLFVTRELAYRDVADGTDSTGDVLEIMHALPAEAAMHLDAYASGTRYARAVAAGEWLVRGLSL